MTTGTKTIGTPNTFGSYSQKTWSGDDGKKELANGLVREKWNNYSMLSTFDGDQYGPNTGLPMRVNGYYPGGIPFPFWDNAAEFSLQSKLFKEIKDHEFNLAVNVAQGRQLVDMVSSNIRKFGRALLALKHGNLSYAARQFGAKNHTSLLDAKDISGRWLELQYGWLPSLSDAFEAAKAYEAITCMRSNRVQVVKAIHGVYDGSAAPSSYQAPGEGRVFGRYIYELEEALSAPRSLGLMDPLSVIWEVIPYSFVVDWFLPIGSYLENLSVAPFLRGRWMRTLRQSARARTGMIFDPDYLNRFRVCVREGVIRECGFNAIAAAKPQFVNSPFLALSARRIFSSIALVHQRLK